MPRLITEDPPFTTDSERHVWEGLRDSLRPQDVLLANYRLTDLTKDHEADLVVVMPDVGVVVVEVKGNGTRIDDGQWTIKRRGARRRGRPP